MTSTDDRCVAASDRGGDVPMNTVEAVAER
jgi:hypothetical protein